ncbi:hypothetical protein EPN95_04545 [Patescibacteria group bacterium]|nr:MAG: hypothetical protein EPN95_04545 [Patescibacteria group bacterium]
MSNRYEYPQINAAGQATNEGASVDLVSNPGSTMFVYIEKLDLSVFKAASGGGGIAEVKDTDGNVIYTISVDGVKDIPLDFGEEGLKVGPGVGIQLAVSGAQSEQASVSAALSGHLAFR